MLEHRLTNILKSQRDQNARDLFGEYELVPAGQSVRRAPVKRVAILSEAFLPKVDGVSKTAYLTLRYLQETGRKVLVFAPDESIPNVGETEVVRLPSFGFPGVPETRTAVPHLTLSRRLAEFQPDLIHLFSPALMSVNGMAMGRHLNVPVIANYQTDLPGYARQYGMGRMSRVVKRWLRYIHNGCHLTLVPAKSIMCQLHGWDFHRLRLWGRGVNTSRFHPKHYSSAMRKKLLNGRDPDSLICLYVGRLANEKRVDLLLDVARLSGVALTIIGDGAKRDELETLFAGTNTYFTGYLYGEELAQAYASADVFAFTGQNETFGQVTQEAMASGLPTVVINEGGAPDLVEEGITGFTCPANSLAFADKIRILRDNPELRQTMAVNAHTVAAQRPWSAIMAQLEGYYREALHMNRRFIRVYGSTTYHVPLPIPSRLQRGR